MRSVEDPIYMKYILSENSFATPQKTLCNFLNIGRILTKPVPIERSRPGLSIDTGVVKIRPVSTKLGGPKSNPSKRLQF